MKEGKEGHFHAEHKVWQTDFDVRRLESGAGLDGTSTREEGDGNGLPETQEDDKFDGQDFEQRSVLRNIGPNLNVELDNAVHGNGDSNRLNDHDPDVCKDRIQGLETVSTRSLSDDGHDRHEDANEAVLEDTSPDNLGDAMLSIAVVGQEDEWAYIEPCQATSWCPPNAGLSSPQFLNPGDRHDPRFGCYGAKVIFLFMEIVGQVMAQQGKEGGDSKSLIAVAEDFEIDAMSVVSVREPGDGGINGNHEENADNAAYNQSGFDDATPFLECSLSLLSRFRVMGSMHQHEVEGQGDSDQGKDGGNILAQLMYGMTMPDGDLGD